MTFPGTQKCSWPAFQEEVPILVGLITRTFSIRLLKEPHITNS